MPIDINSSINSITREVFGNNLLSTMVGKPWALGLFISVVFMFLIMIYYPAKSSVKMSTIFKIFVYIFISTTCLIFIHDGVLKNRYEEKNTEDTSADMITAIGGNDPVYGNYSKVTPEHRQMNIIPEPSIEETVKEVERIVQELPTKTLGGAMPPPEKQNIFRHNELTNV